MIWHFSCARGSRVPIAFGSSVALAGRAFVLRIEPGAAGLAPSGFNP